MCFVFDAFICSCARWKCIKHFRSRILCLRYVNEYSHVSTLASVPSYFFEFIRRNNSCELKKYIDSATYTFLQSSDWSKTLCHVVIKIIFRFQHTAISIFKTVPNITDFIIFRSGNKQITLLGNTQLKHSLHKS